MNEIKEIIAQNLTKLRQSRNMTQSELADILNYSDKSISKWEHGDATPPIEVLKQLADLYDVSLDFLVTENPNEVYDKHYGAKINNPNKLIITLLAVSLIWLSAVILYVYGSLLAGQNYWILFIIAVPASVVILMIFNGFWGKSKYKSILSSIFVWTTLASIYLYFVAFNPWMIFFIGIPLQIGIILWSQLKPSKTKK